MTAPLRLDQLDAALGLSQRELVAIVGGGGKTSTLFALGKTVSARTILTTTTKMGSERTDGNLVVIDPSDRELREAIADHGRVIVWSDRGDHRADGVSPGACDRWFAESVADRIAVEADGSRRRPFKAPAEWEPVIPARSTVVLACIGRDALNAPIDTGCHRPALVAELLGCGPGDLLTPERAAAVLLDRNGSMKSVPERARYAVLVHRAVEVDPVVDELIDRLGDTEAHLVLPDD